VVLVSGVLTAAAAGVTLARWLSREPGVAVELRVPGMDGRDTAATSMPSEVVKIGEYFKTFDGTAASIEGSWPGFRGPSRDNVSPERVSLADVWPTAGPPVLWSVDLGEGYAAPAIHNGRVYVLDYDEDAKADALRCFSLADGKEIWRRWYSVKLKKNHGYSRTIPAVTDAYVVTMGPRCHVMCVDAVSGDLLWGLDLEREYGVKVPLWYTGQCPLIDEGVAVLGVGGKKALLVGVECKTGKILWTTPNPNGYAMTHSSVMPMRLYGVPMYVYAAKGAIVGVGAEGKERGKVLWKTSEWTSSVIAPSPLMLGKGRVLMTAGYGGGSILFQVDEEDEGRHSVRTIRKLSTKQGLCSEQQTPILFQGHVFGILPKDAGRLKRQFVCVHPDDHGTPVWTSGKADRFGIGPFLVADRKFFILDDHGVLTLARVSVDGFEKLAQAKVLEGADSWGPMALVGNRLIVRDLTTMACLDVGQPKAGHTKE
jgi:outer membrane protein assembly factor BamB